MVITDVEGYLRKKKNIEKNCYKKKPDIIVAHSLFILCNIIWYLFFFFIVYVPKCKILKIVGLLM